MIDLHSHILPSLDDGAADLNEALAMAQAYVADGVEVVACTPHILPGLYHNTGTEIRKAVGQLQAQIIEAGIDLTLVTGADNHVVPDFAQAIAAGHLLTLADSRYVLVEPPHHVAPPGLDKFFFDLIVAGYTPILTHPERLTWIRQHYALIAELVGGGVWMQITSGSLIGRFGKGPRYWGERMLDDGLVHILASDAHNTERRKPDLGRGRDAAAKRVGVQESENLVATRPKGVLENIDPAELAPPPGTGMPLGGVHEGGDNESGARSARGGFSGCLRRLIG
ncbi:MAG: tyrosine-protein phosphatase [Hyphomicrobiaceae bacterium]